MQSRLSIVTPREVILGQGDSEDVSVETTCTEHQPSILVKPSKEGGDVAIQDLGLRDDQSPDVSVNAPRLDLIPEFNLNSREPTINKTPTRSSTSLPTLQSKLSNVRHLYNQPATNTNFCNYNKEDMHQEMKSSVSMVSGRQDSATWGFSGGGNVYNSPPELTSKSSQVSCNSTESLGKLLNEKYTIQVSLLWYQNFLHTNVVGVR